MYGSATAVSPSSLRQLPQPRTSLIGREYDVATLSALLLRDDVAALTLTGPGGVGKTRLAIAVAHEAHDAFPDGVWFVDLAPLTDPSLVLPTIAQTLVIQSAETQPVIDTLSAWLRERSVLLLIDNVEHVIEVAPQIGVLVNACPGLTILATSRVPLHLHTEHVYPLAPLALPGTDTTPLIDLEQAGAVQLFLLRARMAGPDFQLTPENAPIIVEICRRLDGLPLAIELAAARMRVLSPVDLLARLGTSLALLTSDTRDIPERQRTIRDTIAWSYDLLPQDTRQLFRQLSIFRGGWTLDAAETVSATHLDLLHELGMLVDHSLILRSEQPDGSTRFGMLETIREFGLDQLDARGETLTVIGWHEAYILTLVQPAGEALHSSQQERFDRLATDHDNVRAALNTALQRGDGETTLRIAVAIGDFWHARNHMVEGLHWLERAVTATPQAPATLRATAYTWIGEFARQQGKFAEAEEALEQAIALYREEGDRVGITSATNTLAWTAVYQGHYEQASALYEQAVEMARGIPDLQLLAMALAGQAMGLGFTGEFAGSLALANESLALYREADDRAGIARALGYIGNALLYLGDLDGAVHFANECIVAARGLNDFWQEVGQEILGAVAIERGEWETARTIVRETLVFSAKEQYTLDITMALESLVEIAVGTGDALRGARLLGAAERLRERSGCPVPPPDREKRARTIETIRARLTLDAFTEARVAGRQMTLDDAIAYALEPGSPDIPASFVPLSPPSHLTKREIDVLRLIADGRSNKEIAALLFIGPGTVATHVVNILSKLGVESRTAAAAWAIHAGIVEHPPL